MFSTGPIDSEKCLGRHSMTACSLLTHCIASPSARMAGSPSSSTRRSHAESHVQHIQGREQFTARCILQESVIRELWFFVWLAVMWIVCDSDSHAADAPVAETRVRELVRGLLRCIWTDWNALSSGIPLRVSWFE